MSSTANASAAVSGEIRRQNSAIESTPLIGVCVALLLAALPLTDQIAPWTMAVFSTAIAIRLAANWRHFRLPSLTLKILLLAGGIGGIVLNYRSVLGIEPGLGILLLLLALKLLETNSVRDFQVVSILGWFLSLCSLFFAQDFSNCLYVGAVCALLLASLVRFHRGPGPNSFGQATRLMAILLFQAAPLVLGLFLFFPRTYGGFRFTFSRPAINSSGMSEKMEPGSVAALATSDAPAFRVEFPDQSIPLTANLYWRGGVLWKGEGLQWERGALARKEPELSIGAAQGIRQRVMLEPHGGRWIFALDQPAKAGANMTIEAGNFLQSSKPVLSALRYEVVSYQHAKKGTLLPEHRVQALQKPLVISSRVQKLVESWRLGAPSDRAIVDRAFSFFGDGKFLYTLQPDTYSGDALDQFLFERKRGFCEHYAAAFATLMRIAEIPARVVIGYHGGEFNSLGQYAIVRQSDAHAWCEVWLEENGWVRIDPVDAIAPDRIQEGLNYFLQSHAKGDQENARESRFRLKQLSHQLRMAWDGLNYEWGLRVLNFDEENQRAFFASLGLSEQDWPKLMGWGSGAIGLFLGALVLYLRRGQSTRVDPVVEAYLRFCQILAKAGLPRAGNEGPSHYVERAARRFPAQAGSIRRIGALYIKMRYSAHPPTQSQLAKEVGELGKMKWIQD